VSLIRQNAEHIALHGQSALQHGASKTQLIEVMPLALLMDGAPAISQIPRLLAVIDAEPV
jgi:alkylhydroperoxidase/carboxymuconolactone decarboxylase family protein YurZ